MGLVMKKLGEIISNDFDSNEQNEFMAGMKELLKNNQQMTTNNNMQSDYEKQSSDNIIVKDFDHSIGGMKNSADAI